MLIRKLVKILKDFTPSFILTSVRPFFQSKDEILRNELFKKSNESIIQEIQSLQVVNIEVKNSKGIIELNSGKKFYSFISRRDKLQFLYDQLPKEMKNKFQFETIKCAQDIIFRYRYPHMDPNAKPDIPFEIRKFWHPQHFDTIDDFKLSDEKKDFLKKRFAIIPNDYIIDIGAHTGMGALAIEERLGNGGRIAAVEADEENFKLLKLNLEANKSKKVKPINLAIWNKSQTMKFYKSDYQATKTDDDLLKTDKTFFNVEAVTIDDLVRDLGWNRVDYISLTINGAEPEALQGAEETLKINKHIRLSICGWYKVGGKKVSSHIVPFLKERGFSCYVGQEGKILAMRE